MAPEKKQRLTLEITARAERALQDIWQYNAAEWGEPHADRYIAFLRAETEKLAAGRGNSRAVPNALGYRFSIMRRGRARGHGHIAVFEVDGGALRVLDFHHTAQNWRSHYGQGEE